MCTPAVGTHSPTSSELLMAGHRRKAAASSKPTAPQTAARLLKKSMSAWRKPRRTRRTNRTSPLKRSFTADDLIEEDDKRDLAYTSPRKATS